MPLSSVSAISSRLVLALLRLLRSSSTSCRVCARGVVRSAGPGGGTDVLIGEVNAPDVRLSSGNILDSGVVGDLAVASELSVAAEEISAGEMTTDFRG